MIEPDGFPSVVEREIGSTLAAFERDLRQAWPDVQRNVHGALVLSDEHIELVIELQPLESRRLGLLTLPRLRAVYHFRGGDSAARRALLRRLDLAMQRGGG